MLALTSANGKLGSAVLNAILDNKLIDPKDIVVCVCLPHTITTSTPLTSSSDFKRPFLPKAAIPP